MPVDPRYDPAFQRGFEGTLTTAVAKRETNPLLIVAWVLAALLVVAGTVGMLVPSVGNPFTLSDYLVPLVAHAVAPWVLAAGSVLFVGGVVVQVHR